MPVADSSMYFCASILRLEAQATSVGPSLDPIPQAYKNPHIAVPHHSEPEESGPRLPSPELTSTSMLPKLIGFRLDGTCLLSLLSWAFSAQSWVRTHSSINQFSVCTCWRDLTPQQPGPGRLCLNQPLKPSKA